jgi:hypothetical protein
VNQSTTGVYLPDSAVLDVEGLHVAGEAEGGASTIVGIHVNAGVTTVRLQIPGGGADAMAPDRWLGRTCCADWRDPRNGTGTPESGKVVAIAPVTQPALANLPATSCEPTPPSLSPPGPQPSDPPAARAGVLNAFAQVYQLNAPTGSAYVDGWTAAIGDADTKELKQRTIASVTARINSIVFTSPSAVAVEYDLLVPPFGPFTGRSKAVLVQGVWKVQAATVCTDISLGGVSS